MNALVISGGGSKGAFAGGVAEYLMVDMQKTYDLFVGTSTGSLLAPLLAVGDLGLAKQKEMVVSVSNLTLQEQEYNAIFDPIQMTAWWTKGYALFQIQKPVSYSIEPV